MKYVVVMFLALGLVGCGGSEQSGITYSGIGGWELLCIDGVEYLHRRRGHGAMLAPHMKADGSVHTCGG